MSIFNGYKDVLVYKQGYVFKVDGLSPAGHVWVNDNIAAQPWGSVYPEHVGRLVSTLVSSGLSVEIR